MRPTNTGNLTVSANETTPLNTPLDLTDRCQSQGGSINPFRRFFRTNSSHTQTQRHGSKDNDDDEDADHNVINVNVNEHQPDYIHVRSLLPKGGRDPVRQLHTPPAQTSKADNVGTIDDGQHGIEPSTADDGSHVHGDPRFIGISPRRFWVIFSVLMLAFFLAHFDSTLMASSHPVVTSYFKASQAASWLSTVFLITSTAFQPLFGRLSDTIGRKTLLLTALLVFLLATMWCALATSIESFIAARAVCGIGAGGTMSMCLIMVSDMVRLEYRGIFQSHINFAFGAGSAAGAAFGGLLCDSLGWRWAFGIQVPVIALCLILATVASPRDLGPMLIKQGEGDAWAAIKTFDSLGSVLLISMVTCFILALNLGGTLLPWTHPLIITFVVAFLLTAALLISVENKVQYPLMPLHLLTKTPVANLVFINFLGNIAINTVRFNAPLFFQAVMLTSASTSGLRLAIPSLVDCLTCIATGYIITYTRKLKPILILGGVFYLIGSVLLLLLTRHTSSATSMVLIAGIPLGQGLVFPTTMMSALAVTDQSAQAVVTTTIGVWRTLGTVVGVALSSLIFQNALVSNLHRIVTGPSRESVIRAVRESVGAIHTLDPTSRQQVITAYAESLRSAFLCALVASVLANLLILPVRLPRLKPRSDVPARGSTDHSSD